MAAAAAETDSSAAANDDDEHRATEQKSSMGCSWSGSKEGVAGWPGSLHPGRTRRGNERAKEREAKKGDCSFWA